MLLIRLRFIFMGECGGLAASRGEEIKAMKATRIYLIACLLVIIVTSAIHAQWVQSGGPYGGRITCFAVKDSAIFAGTETGGIFRSTDTGAHWTSVNAGLTDLNIKSLAMSGNNGFAGTKYGFFHSTDNGASWSSAGLKVGSYDFAAYSLAANGSSIFAAAGPWVMRSSNNGASWDSANTKVDIRSLGANGRIIVAGTFGGILISSDNGATWNPVNIGPQNDFVQTVAFLGTTILLGASQSGVFLSTDTAATWTKMNNGLSDTSISALAVMKGKIFAGTPSGVFVSSDSGKIWSLSNAGLSANTDVHALAVGGAVIFTGTGGNALEPIGGVYRSLDNGANWNAVNTGLSNINVQALFLRGGSVFAGSDGGIFISSDNGHNWTAANAGLTKTDVFSIAADDSNVYAGTSLGIFSSADSGIHWDSAGLPKYIIYALATNDSSVFAGGGRLFRSMDRGGHWTDISTANDESGNKNQEPSNVMSLAAVGTTVYAGTYFQGFFRSIDNGQTWTDITSNLSGRWITTLLASGGNIYAANIGTVIVLPLNDTIGVEVNNWTSTGDKATRALAIKDSAVFTGCNGGRVYLSVPGASHWLDISAGLPPAVLRVNALCVNDTTVFAGTYGCGVWRRSLADILHSPIIQRRGADKLQKQSGIIFSRRGIGFYLQKPGFVSLKIYDLLGKELATLVNSTLNAGNHQASLKRAFMSNGVYVCRLTYGGIVVEKTITLQK